MNLPALSAPTLFARCAWLLLVAETLLYAVLVRGKLPGLHWVFVFMLALAGLVVVRVVLFALNHLLAGLLTNMPWPGFLPAISIAAREIFCMLLEYLVIQPFGFLHYAADPPEDDRQGEPVLFVHGYMCDGSMWWWFRRRFQQLGIGNTWSMSLTTPISSIDKFAEQLNDRIDEICSKSSQQKITIIAHSMGGLVARRLLTLCDGSDARIARIITLGTPHQGTFIAYPGLGWCAMHMWPTGRWIRNLRNMEEQTQPAAEMHSVYSRHDQVIIPASYSDYAHAQNRVVDGLGHMNLVFSKHIAEICAQIIQTPASHGNQPGSPTA